MAIIRPVNIEICVCGEHGHLVLSDGKFGREFFSKEEAREELNQVKKNDFITDYEVRYIASAIAGEDYLPESPQEVDPEASSLCEIFNKARGHKASSDEGDEEEDASHTVIH